MTGTKERGIVLQDRDRHLLAEVALMRVIDRETARRVAPFGSVTRANARLLNLTRSGLLRRFFIGTGSGGKKALYTLSSSGARLIGASSTGPKRSRDELVVADFFVAHQSHVNDIYCGFRYGGEAPLGMSFRRWLAFASALDASTPLVPDGYVEFGRPDKTLAAFIEVDLGNERLSVWREKVRHYLQYAVAGQFEKRFGTKQFLVLVAVDSRGRLDSLRATTAGLTEKIFRFATFASIHPTGPWSPVWFKPKGDEPHALAGTP